MMIVDEEHREIVVECREQHVNVKRTQLNNLKELGRARNLGHPFVEWRDEGHPARNVQAMIGDFHPRLSVEVRSGGVGAPPGSSQEFRHAGNPVVA
jgi:hypothetical protein